MDWARARAILLAAFTVVNLILAYSIWSPTTLFPYLDEPQGRTTEQFRDTLLNCCKLVLPTNVPIPRTPPPMRFLRVEAHPTPDLVKWSAEVSGTTAHGARDDIALAESLRPAVDSKTRTVEYFPLAMGIAAKEVKLDNRHQVSQVAEEYLRTMSLFPPGAVPSGMIENSEKETMTVEYVPFFDGRPVYSGYVRAEVSPRGVEKVTQLWVTPRGYTAAPAKQVRPASEALLRLAGRLAGAKVRTVTEIQLGYYAGRTLSPAESDDVHGWDTVPVWRITLDGSEMYYINAFTGEWES